MALFETGEGEEDPPTGNFLGDLTDELDESGEVVIGEWVRGGPKNYRYAAYDLPKDRVDDGFRKVEFKCKGVMNNNASCRIVNYEVLKDVMIDSCCSAADEE